MPAPPPARGPRSGALAEAAAISWRARAGLAFFHAAIAALAVLLEQTFQVWRFDATANDFVQAGITSAAFFATAALASTLAGYARTSAEIAEERRLDLDNLSQINELVIRAMQAG